MKKNILFELGTRRTTVLFVFIALLLGCARSVSDQKEEARKAMIALMNSYTDAMKELNVEKVTSFFLHSPEFMFYADGKSQNYDDIVTQVRDLFPNLRSYEGKWDNIFVSVLNSNAVAAAAPFHEVLTDKNGVETRLKGEVTWIAVRVENNWKFIYAHASYQPDTVK